MSPEEMLSVGRKLAKEERRHQTRRTLAILAFAIVGFGLTVVVLVLIGMNTH